MKQILFLALILPLLLACSISNVATSFLATPTPVCNAKQYITDTSVSWLKFADATNRANSTARIALTTVISDMQSSRRDFMAVPFQACESKYRTAAIEAMDATIDAYMSFMAQDIASNVSFSIGLATIKTKAATDELNKLIESAE